MKIKIIVIVVVFFLLLVNLIASADKNADKYIKNFVEDYKIIKNVRVALLYEEPIGTVIGTAKRVFPNILQKPWVVGNISYRFIVTPIYDKDILNDQLTVDNYDILLCPGGDVGDGESMIKGFYRLPKAKKWKENIAQFIKDGGGYYGVCGGASMFTGLSKKPTTFYERQFDKCDIGVSCVKLFYDTAIPILYPFHRSKPEKLGAALYFFAFPCFDVQINTNHPIFDDYLETTRRIMWIGGPAFVVPDNPKREVDVLARYPADLSENESLRVHVWKYTGGVLGLIRGFFKFIKIYRSYGYKMNDILKSIGRFHRYATDWEKTDKILDLKYSNKPSNTADIYPNENQGRIILEGPHPEYGVRFGGHVEEAEDTNDNYLQNIYNWVNFTPYNETIEDEFSYNYWIVRRQVAWAAKVPDNDLPPVYGPSQVSDIYPYNQTSSDINIYGNSETSDGIVSLDLFYRYSCDNESWCDWTLYDTDFDGSDGWSWIFNATLANGLGYYQFYSIRHVDFEGEELIEKVPPGPDAIVHIIN